MTNRPSLTLCAESAIDLCGGLWVGKVKGSLPVQFPDELMCKIHTPGTCHTGFSTPSQAWWLCSIAEFEVMT